MIRDATLAGLFPEQPLAARLDTLIETASIASLDTLDDSEKKLTAQLYLHKAAQAADEAWQQNCTRSQGNGRTVTNPTICRHSDSTSQHDDDGDENTNVPSRKGRSRKGPNVYIGAERNPQTREVIYHVKDLDAPLPEWKINNVRQSASVSTAACGGITL